KSIMLASGPLYDFVRRKTPVSTQLLSPFMANFGLVNNRIPIEHRVQAVIEEFAGGFLLRPTGAAFFIDRSQNHVRVSCAVGVTSDDVSSVLADLKPQVEPHGSLGHAPQYGLQRLLGAVPHVFGVVIRMDSAEF